MNISELLSKFSIRKQILIGYLPIIILFVFIAVNSQQKFLIFSQNFERLAVNTNENLTFLEIERDMNELERSILAFSYVGYEGVLKKIERLQNEINTKLGLVQDVVERDPQARDRYDRLNEHYKNYNDGFKAVITAQADMRQNIDNELEPIYASIQELLKTAKEDARAQGDRERLISVIEMQNIWQQIALNLQYYEAMPNAQNIRETKTLVSKAADIAQNEGSLSTQNNEELEILSRQYKQSHQSLINTKRTYLHLINVVLAGQSAEIDNLLDELDGFAKQQSVSLRDEILKNNHTAKRDFIVFATIATLISLIIAWLVASGIAGPVSKMTATLSQLAKGHFQIKIPAVDRSDEVGEMAKAADAFKNMAVEINDQRQEIEDTRQKLSTIVDNVVDGIITIDTKGIIQSYNSACEKIFGHTAEHAIGKNIKALMPEPYHSNHDQYLADYQKTGIKKIIGSERQVSGKRKDGSTFPMELSISEINISGQKIYTGLVRDISERVVAEKRIKEALQFQNLISENIPDFVFVKDKDFKIVQANPAFLSLYPEDKRDYVLGYTTVEEYPKDQVEKFLEFDRIAMDEGYSETVEAITFPDGSKRVLFTKKTRFENSDGEKFILGISRDITDSKRAEEEILRSNEELERFAYIASHDLQEPLRMISNFTGLLDAEYGEGMDAQAKQYMKFSVDASKRMQALISDLLEYSRANEQEAKLTKFDSGEQIRSALANLQGLIEESEADVTIEKMPEIYSHPMRFSRLMQNLIGNGIKYSDPKRKPKIKVEAKEEKERWVFSISDNGIGIKDEYKEQIFVIFKRLHHKQEYSGTGIGLAICKKIVESFGGQLWVESTYGKGSTFFFTIPKK